MPDLYDRVNVKAKPDWLKTKLHTGKQFASVAQIVETHALNTICDGGKCPNKAECWSRRTATFMVLGNVCTRACGFCATATGKPLPIDSDEPLRVARSIALMGLRHAVITSVTRDDLTDGGAAHWARVVECVRRENPDTTVELLIPDFEGRVCDLDVVLAAGADIVGHNIETVRRLTGAVRSRARYEVSLGVLARIAGAESRYFFGGQKSNQKTHPVYSKSAPDLPKTVHLAARSDESRFSRRLRDDFEKTGEECYATQIATQNGERCVAKSGLMVGLGETVSEVLGAMDDLRSVGVEILTIGQYLQPTRRHLPVAEYVTPEVFEFYRTEALARGFAYVASAPLVRSSYMAEQALGNIKRKAV